MTTLYHFTCAHGRRRIGRYNCLLVPNEHPFLHCAVVWLTTEPAPDRFATGLGQTYTPCDRMAFRYVVADLSSCEPWLDSDFRRFAPASALTDLESYGDPEHWWIAGTAVRATFDPSWRPPDGS